MCFLVTIMAAPVGIGGGGILVPLFIYFGNFGAHAAIPLSKATIFGGAIANSILNLMRRHPFANRPLVDWIALKLVLPNLLAGTIFGVLLLAMAPAWIVLLMVSVVMAFNSWKTSNRAITDFNSYMKQLREREGEKLLAPRDRKKARQHWSFVIHDNPEINAIIEKESHFDFKAMGMVLLAWILVVICEALKATSTTCGGVWFYFLAIAPVPVLIIMTWRTGLDVVAMHDRKVALGLHFKTGETRWTRDTVMSIGALSLVAGAAAGALGIAAALLIGPLLLQAGMHPSVSMACTGFMILVVSSATTMQFLFMGQLKLDYALCFCSAALMGGGLGNTIMAVLVKKLKTSWFLVAILAAFLVLSAVSLGFIGAEELVTRYQRGDWADVRDFCSDSEGMLVARDEDDLLVGARLMTEGRTIISSGIGDALGARTFHNAHANPNLEDPLGWW